MVALQQLKDAPAPERVFQILSQEEGCVWLDSSLKESRGRSRWSIISSNPLQTLSSAACVDLAGELSRFRENNKIAPVGDLPFCGGWIGHFEYPEQMPPYPTERQLPLTGWFGLYDCAVIWDHQKNEAWLLDASEALGNTSRAAEWHRNWMTKLKKNPSVSPLPLIKSAQLTSNLEAAQYKSMVAKAREWIAAGDIYQVNLAQFLSCETMNPSQEIYRALRHYNPAPYSSYLDCGSYQVLSSSPESFLELDAKGIIRTSPIKGTRPRGVNPEQDRALAKELLSNQKEKAELLMIVDMERNDLGRICEAGSIHVPSIYQLESYASVHHLVGTVEGLLKPGTSLEKLLSATFPGGSISGAPKYRAMEIIRELEDVPRNAFCGCIGLLSLDGQIHTSIAIRSIQKTGKTVRFGVGSGIVWDSDPESEYQETWHKAQRLLQALSVK